MKCASSRDIDVFVTKDRDGVDDEFIDTVQSARDVGTVLQHTTTSGTRTYSSAKLAIKSKESNTWPIEETYKLLPPSNVRFNGPLSVGVAGATDT